MLHYSSLIFGLISIVLSACDAKDGAIDRRGNKGETKGAAQPVTSDGNQIKREIELPDLTIEAKSELTLSLRNSVDTSGMPAGFLDELRIVHKSNQDRLTFFSKTDYSWSLRESSAGQVERLSIDAILPKDSKVYILPEKSFWLFGSKQIAYPQEQKNPELGQLAILNFAPDVIAEMSSPTNVLYAGTDYLILSNETRANIVMKSGDSIRYINFDLPKDDGTTVRPLSAGLGAKPDMFWFSTAKEILVLQKDKEEKWRWVVSKLKLELPVEAESYQSLAMVIDLIDGKQPSPVGRVIAIAGGKLYEKSALKLMPPDANAGQTETPNVSPIEAKFISDVQPIFKDNCVSCHAGYDSFTVAKDKASAFKARISSLQMPPAGSTPLTPDQIKKVADWYTLLGP